MESIFQGLGLSLIPLASFWATFNSLLSAAQFVNEIRDTVISGVKNSAVLSKEVRLSMKYDWILAMIGTIGAALLFAGLLIWMGWYIRIVTSSWPVTGAVWAVASYPIIGSVLFFLCGRSDIKAMNQAIHLTPRQSQETTLGQQ